MTFESTFTEGAITANITPMNNDLSVDYQKLISHIRYLLDNGSNGIALLGTTGEANSFTIDERIELMDKVFFNGFKPEKFLVGTGCCAINDTVRLTKHAISHNSGGVLMLPPFYYKQVSEEGLFQYFSKVVDEVNDDRLRIYLYHFPKMSGVFLSNSLLEKLINRFPGVFVGMKDSSGDFEHMKSLMQNFPGFKLYTGTEHYLLETLKIGGVGCISASANVTSGLIANVYNNRTSSEKALSMQKKVSAARSAFAGLPFVAVIKQYFARIHNDNSYTNMRPPNYPVDEKIVDDLMEKLQIFNLSRK